MKEHVQPPESLAHFYIESFQDKTLQLLESGIRQAPLEARHASPSTLDPPFRGD